MKGEGASTYNNIKSHRGCSGRSRGQAHSLRQGIPGHIRFISPVDLIVTHNLPPPGNAKDAKIMKNFLSSP